MGTDNLVFLEVIEWFDEGGRSIAHRIPEKGSGGGASRERCARGGLPPR